jgi:signal transduction histidine kinase
LFAGDRSTITAALPATGIVTCDPDLIVRVIDNLVENGLHAVSPGGSVEVGAHQEEGAWLLIVRDSGAGIDVEEATSLLDDPSRRPAARSRKAGGSGLGLALSAVIVRAHGGAIDVDSSPQGSVFTVRLPADPGDADDADPNMTKT